MLLGQGLELGAGKLPGLVSEAATAAPILPSRELCLVLGDVSSEHATGRCYSYGRVVYAVTMLGRHGLGLVVRTACIVQKLG